MTEKRFKVHSMIQGTKIGETIDLELCEELIKKYGSLSDIDLLIEDNGNNMTYQEAVDLLNENEQLKQRNDRQAKQLDRLYSLVEEKDWAALSDIIDDFKRCEEQLQKEWGTYNDFE
mgnify:CR=1 FL=1